MYREFVVIGIAIMSNSTQVDTKGPKVQPDTLSHRATQPAAA